MPGDFICQVTNCRECTDGDHANMQVILVLKKQNNYVTELVNTSPVPHHYHCPISFHFNYWSGKDLAEPTSDHLITSSLTLSWFDMREWVSTKQANKQTSNNNKTELQETKHVCLHDMPLFAECCELHVQPSYICLHVVCLHVSTPSCVCIVHCIV